MSVEYKYKKKIKGININNSTQKKKKKKKKKKLVFLDFIKIAHIMQKFENQVNWKVVIQEIACVNGQISGIKMWNNIWSMPG